MPDESLSMATNLGEPVKATHDGWTIQSSSAIRPTEAQLKESLGAPPEDKSATEEAPNPDALSADAGGLESDPPPAPETVEGTTDGVSGELPGDGSAVSDGKPAKPKKLTRAQELYREIAVLTRQKGEITRETDTAKAQRHALSTEIADLEAKAAALKTPETKTTEAAPAGPRKALNPAPKPVWATMEAAGKTYEDFLDAREDWLIEEQRLVARDESAKTVTEREQAAREASTREQRERAEADIDAKYKDRLANARLAHPDVDFDAVMSYPLPIKSDMPGFRAMGDRIRVSEVGPELLLYFSEDPHAQDPERSEARRIAMLPWPHALAELGMIEGGIKARATANSGSVAVPAPSKAHAPIKPVRVAAPVASDTSRRSFDDEPFGPGYLQRANKVLGMR